MKIEGASQARPEYRKTTASATTSKTFGQAMEATKAQDLYVPSAPQPRTEAEFAVGEQRYGFTISNATHAKLKQLAEIDKQADYTGMSSDEIYAEIWNRYDEAFDGNMVAITACIGGPAEWSAVNNQFEYEILHHIVYPEERAALKAVGAADASTYEEKKALEISCNEKAHQASTHGLWKVLGYEGMSFEERESAIKEKYTGKNTTLDFLKMQGELVRSGVLKHKMGDKADTYCAMIEIQFDRAFNPNSIDRVGYEKSSFMTADQWYRVANQPFDATKFAAAMKEHLGTISGPNNYSADIVKMMEDCINRFVQGVTGDGLDRLLSETKK